MENKHHDGRDFGAIFVRFQNLVLSQLNPKIRVEPAQTNLGEKKGGAG